MIWTSLTPTCPSARPSVSVLPRAINSEVSTACRCRVPLWSDRRFDLLTKRMAIGESSPAPRPGTFLNGPTSLAVVPAQVARH
jgi:hypothetical protein